MQALNPIGISAADQAHDSSASAQSALLQPRSVPPVVRRLSRSLSLDSFQDAMKRRADAEIEDKLFDMQLLQDQQLPTNDLAQLSAIAETWPPEDLGSLLIPREKGLPAACIFIAHLEKNISDRALHQALFRIVEKFGMVLDLQVHRDAKYFRPFAFCQFKNVADAERAVHHLSGQLLYDRPLRVEKARVNRTLFISKMERDMDEKKIHDIVSQYGPLEEIKMLRDKSSGAFKGCVFVKFMYRQDAINATLPLESYDYKVELVANLSNPTAAADSPFGTDIATTPVDAPSQPPPPQGECLYLHKLPLSVNETDLVEKFSAYGKITALNLLRRNVSSAAGFYNGSNYAYLTYASADSASQAIRYEHNTLWIDKFISVEYARALPSPLGASSAGLQQQW